jgi:multidrug resistance efflux pump
MEIDDLDREIQRIHDTFLLKKAQLASSQRLAQKGLVSRSDLEREVADVRYQEAREVETLAFRALKVYERDVLGRAIPPDEQRAYTLLLDWIKAQEAIAQVDVDYRGFHLKQTRALFQRRAVSRHEVDDAELDYNTALANVALSRSRQAQVAMELAARKGEKPYDPAEYQRLKAAYLKARIHYFEITAEGATNRLDIARERSRIGLIPTSEITLFQKAANDADDALAVEREKLAEHEAGKASASKAK